MAYQPIDVGAFVDDTSAESIREAFTAVNAMTLELFTELALGSRQVIDLSATPDTIRGAFVKTNTNMAALYTEQSLPSVPVIDVGDAPDDPVPTAETIYAAFTKVNTALAAVYASLEPPPTPETGDYYVATTGSDNNPGTIGSPFRTINKGVTLLGPGKTLLVRAGVYVEALANKKVPAGTSWTNKVRIAAYPGETVWMKPGDVGTLLHFGASQRYIEFDGINLDGDNVRDQVVKVEYTTTITAAHHIRIQNADVTGVNSLAGGSPEGSLIAAAATQPYSIGFNEFINLRLYRSPKSPESNRTMGFYIQSGNNLIDGCEIFDMIGSGGQFWNNSKNAPTAAAPGTNPDNNILRNCYIHDFPASTDTTKAEQGRAWIDGNGNNNQMYNNVMHTIRNTSPGGSAGGIYVWKSDNAKVYHNTVWDSATSGIVIDALANGSIVKNNIAYQTGGGTNYRNNGTGSVASNNIFTSNPLFVNAAADDFHLQAGSPAINAGVAITGITTDFDGVTRGTPPDIGAYEKV